MKLKKIESTSSYLTNVFEEMRHLNRDLMNDQVGFMRLSNYLGQLTGVSLPSNLKNHALMANRVGSILKTLKIKKYTEYFNILQQGDPRLINEFISALTTHTTHFFREVAQLDLFKKILIEYIKSKEKSSQTEIRIWCAAASTGQEPYSLAIIVKEVLALQPFSRWNVKILATDIDLASLEYAAKGVYTPNDISSLPAEFQHYLSEKKTKDISFYRIDQKLKSMIRFAPLNLMDVHYPFQNKFDFIFCRNVLIYFEDAVSTKIIGRFEDALSFGGHLIVGASESGYIKKCTLTQLAPSVYIKKNTPGAK